MAIGAAIPQRSSAGWVLPGKTPGPPPRLADEYDAAQARGEVTSAGPYDRANVASDNVSPATAAGLAVAGGFRSNPAPNIGW